MDEVPIKAQIPAAVWEKNLHSAPDSKGAEREADIEPR